jgi:hypothetical protein
VFSKSKLAVEYYAYIFNTAHLNKGFVIQVYFNFFLSFLFLFVISITFDLCSLNLILLLTAHDEILLNSTLAMFSSSHMDSVFIIITKLSANATAFVLVYFSVRRELILYVPKAESG